MFSMVEESPAKLDEMFAPGNVYYREVFDAKDIAVILDTFIIGDAAVSKTACACVEFTLIYADNYNNPHIQRWTQEVFLKEFTQCQMV